MRPAFGFLLASLLALSACLLPSARPVAYQPHPERVSDPLAVLRKAARSHCERGTQVELLPGKVRYTSACSTGCDGAPKPADIELTGLSDVHIVFGDWYQVVLVRHGEEQYLSELACDTSEEAAEVADALLALRSAAPRPPR